MTPWPIIDDLETRAGAVGRRNLHEGQLVTSTGSPYCSRLRPCGVFKGEQGRFVLVESVSPRVWEGSTLAAPLYGPEVVERGGLKRALSQLAGTDSGMTSVGRDFQAVTLISEE